MEHSAGRLVIGAAGAIIIAAGLYRVYKGVTMDVNDGLDLSGMSPARVLWTQRLATVGEVGRVSGSDSLGSSCCAQPSSSTPTKRPVSTGALRRLATETWGLLVVFAVGVGFVAYGIFCLTLHSQHTFRLPERVAGRQATGLSWGAQARRQGAAK